MRNDHFIEEAFIEAVNNYITVINQDMIAYGLDESAMWPFVEPISEEYADEELIYRLQAYHFPDNTPHRHLYFFDEFKQNEEYIAFGGNSNYNDVYVVDKRTGKVLVFSEEEIFLNSCADSFAAFLEAFIVLIDLDTRLGRKQKIANPQTILDEAVAAAGGEEYRAFYQFIFPISVEKSLN